MRASFDNKLNELNRKLLDMAAMVEQIIAMSIKSLEKQDEKLAKETVGFDEKINEAEREVERICLNLLLQYQPVFADDLRRVSAALKMITDMERVGDQAADIAELNIMLIKKKQRWELSDISEMARAATTMVTEAIDAYVNNDEELAKAVIKSDDKIDELFVKTKDKIINEIAADKANGEKAIDTLMVAKYFERIGDHAVNIAEWVVFSITGVHKTERIM
ncbi:phosphate signaling complex protein PhoU [Ruminococcus sp.]|mgnify:CR=1 FL=1|uniref:phosphate signaling complex protein PhoU n=1 Tax=Ruminococcus sp. TaxID=41978 RepID=UPI0025DAC8BC|nr:phosphate signaling complex protein PhoU [Ruminococcus sp.]